MKSMTIMFKREGYDPFIDYLKGVCILFVVIQHSMPPLMSRYTAWGLWGRFAVPLFLLIQVFHTYKRNRRGNNFINFKKLWKRILFPFFIVQFIISIYLFLSGIKTLSQITHSLFFSGGIGPGGYYPWIYIQMALVLPLIAILFDKFKRPVLLLLFILTAQLLEICCCLTDMPGWLYRLCFFRYFFIIYLGYLLATRGFTINIRTIVLSFLCFLCVCFFTFKAMDLRPVFYTGMKAWKQCHWPCYIYMCFILLPIFKRSWMLLQHHNSVATYIKLMGKYSYEIFLFQMAWFSIASKPRADEGLLWGVGFMVFSIVVCIVPVVFVKNRITIQNDKSINLKTN